MRHFKNRFGEQIDVLIDQEYMGGQVQQVTLFQIQKTQKNYIWSLLYARELDLSTFILFEIASLSKPSYSGYSDKTSTYYFFASRETAQSLEKDKLEFYILKENIEKS